MVGVFSSLSFYRDWRSPSALVTDRKLSLSLGIPLCHLREANDERGGSLGFKALRLNGA